MIHKLRRRTVGDAFIVKVTCFNLNIYLQLALTMPMINILTVNIGRHVTYIVSYYSNNGLERILSSDSQSYYLLIQFFQSSCMYIYHNQPVYKTCHLNYKFT